MSQERRTAADERFLLVRSSASDVAGGSRIADHRHDWHQLVYVAAGLAAVDTPRGTCLAPPSWAVWIPAGADHAIRFVGRSSLRTIYLRFDQQATLSNACCAVSVSPLLRELVLRSVALGMLDGREPIEAALATLIVSELGASGPPPFALPQPSSAPLIEAIQLMTIGRNEAANMAQIARTVGMGLRTFERRFRTETGMTPGRWLQQHKLLGSLEMLASGQAVKAAGFAAGFASPSGYVAAFRQLFGETPGRYFAPTRPTEVPTKLV